MGEWKNFKLSELGEVIGGSTPSTKREEYYGGNIAWITPKDLSGYQYRFISKGSRNISEEGLNSCSLKMLPKNSILFTSRAPIGYVAIAENDLCTNQGFKSIIPNENVDYMFMYYLMKYNKEIIEAMGSGTTFKEVSGTVMKNVYVKIPIDKKEQQKISKILSSLDEKIEINRKINENLEEQAKEIFKRWFVDYEFPNEEGQPYKSSGGEIVESELGLIPKGWEKINLGDICICELGGTPSRKKNEYWNGNIPWINSGSVNLFRIIKANEMISELGLKKSSTKLLPKKTTVIAITGSTLGQVSLLEIDSCTNQSVVGVIPNKNLPYEFIYPYIKANIGELLSHKTGGAQQHINSQNVKNLKVIVPNKKSLEQYTDLISPIYEMISKNCFEIEYLSSIRDKLLPKLMIGEIDVSEIDI